MPLVGVLLHVPGQKFKELMEKKIVFHRERVVFYTDALKMMKQGMSTETATLSNGGANVRRSSYNSDPVEEIQDRLDQHNLDIRQLEVHVQFVVVDEIYELTDREVERFIV